MSDEYRCWSPDDGDDSGAERVATSGGPRAAAELFVERNWADFDHAEVVTVHVADRHNYITYWSVNVTHCPSFDAIQLMHYRPEPASTDPEKKDPQS